MKDDIIYRNQAIYACMKHNGHGSVWAVIMEDIKKLTPAQPETNWTPCSEEMPKKSGKYFVTNFEYGEYVTGINIYDIECGGWLHDIEEPVAWAPMPKPWRDSKDD